MKRWLLIGTLVFPGLAPTGALAGGTGPVPSPNVLEVWEGQLDCGPQQTPARLSIQEWDGQQFKLLAETFAPGTSSLAAALPRSRALLWGRLDADRINLSGGRWLLRARGDQLPDHLSARLQLGSDYRSLKLQLDPAWNGCQAGSFNRVR